MRRHAAAAAPDWPRLRGPTVARQAEIIMSAA